jgi:UDPglucose 6-dehydrogenase
MSPVHVRLAVYGLWHLGCVTAAACASVGHQVLGIDDDAAVVAALAQGHTPIAEPGLDALIAQAVGAGTLGWASSANATLSGTQLLWVAFDTPVDEDDQADVASVVSRVQALLPRLSPGAVVLVSSQVPVGTTRVLESFAAQHCPALGLHFAVSPENLRLGAALKVFLQPDRVVVGVRSAHAKALIQQVLAPITDKIEWMSPESAEMSKHAINAFLAVSVTFANEIATLCEKYGADAKDVERSLKTESRIGPKAYLGPGAAFAGGTLARDIAFLTQMAHSKAISTPVLQAVRPSNQWHRDWERRKLSTLMGSLTGATVGIWGLTYKPGTDTLRRSTAVELCEWLLAQGARLKVHDPAVKDLPASWGPSHVTRCEHAAQVCEGAQALVVCTPWPQYREQAQPEQGAAGGTKLIVLDAARFLSPWAKNEHVAYHAVGSPELGKPIGLTAANAGFLA